MGTKKSLSEKVLPKRLRDDIERVIDPHLRVRANGNGVCSTNTAKDRRAIVHACIAQLWVLGYRITKLDSLAAKHVKALMEFWDDENRSPQFLHNRLSALRTLAGWLGKRHVVGDLSDYFPKERTRRQTATERNRAWKENKVDIGAIIALAKTVDERLAVMLSLQDQFGLRVKESVEFRPLNSLDDKGENLLVYVGTKGAKPRMIPIETPEQRAAFEWARRVVMEGKVKRLRWPNLTAQQARTKFYHMLSRRLGLTKDQLKVTAHGLRYGYAQRKYERDSGGFKSPIENVGFSRGGGGAVPMPIPTELLTVPVQASKKPVPPPGLTRENHHQACLSVSRAMGHERIGVTAAYYGTYGHGLRTVSPPTTMEAPKVIFDFLKR